MCSVFTQPVRRRALGLGSHSRHPGPLVFLVLEWGTFMYVKEGYIPHTKVVQGGGTRPYGSPRSC